MQARLIKFLIILTVFYSCTNDDSAPVVSDVDAAIMAWLDSMNIDAIRDESGIYYYPIDSNDTGNTIAAGQVASIYYVMTTLESDSLIGSVRRGSGDSLIFRQGVAAVYPVGTDRSIELMRTGETYGFIMPPSQAYADLMPGHPLQNEIVKLEMEFTAIQNEEDLFLDEISAIEDFIDDNLLDSLALNPVDSVEFFPASGIFYKRRREGSGVFPQPGDTIETNYGASILGSTFFEQAAGFQYIIGSQSPRPLIPSMEFVFSRLLIGETGTLFTPSSQAYRESALVLPESLIPEAISSDIVPDYVQQVPPYQTLQVDVERTN